MPHSHNNEHHLKQPEPIVNTDNALASSNTHQLATTYDSVRTQR